MDILPTVRINPLQQRRVVARLEKKPLLLHLASCIPAQPGLNLVARLLAVVAYNQYAYRAWSAVRDFVGQTYERAKEGNVYRGMFVTLDQLSEVFKNGFPVGGGEYDAKMLDATAHLYSAAEYAFQPGKKAPYRMQRFSLPAQLKKGIPVILELSGERFKFTKDESGQMVLITSGRTVGDFPEVCSLRPEPPSSIRALWVYHYAENKFVEYKRWRPALE